MSFFFVLCFNLSCQDERQHYPRKHSLGFEEPGNHRKVNYCLFSYIRMLSDSIRNYAVIFFKCFTYFN